MLYPKYLLQDLRIILFLCLVAPAYATDIDLLSVELLGVRLGMDMNSAVATLENLDYQRTSSTSFEKKDTDGTHNVGLKLNPAKAVVNIGIASHTHGDFDPDSIHEDWRKKWGPPDHEDGNASYNWKVNYDGEYATLEAWTRPGRGRSPNVVHIRMAAKGEVLQARRGYEVSGERCLALKNKPVSKLSVGDRDEIMECIRTGQLRLVQP